MKQAMGCFLAAMMLMLGSLAGRAQEVTADSVPLLSVPVVEGHPYAYRPVVFSATPWLGYGIGTWDLHQGLNAQVGAGVRVGWGKHSPWRGASFFSNLAAMYALPMSKDGRWTAAFGGYFNNFRLWGQQVNTLGLVGMVDYRINERLDVSGFLMHDFGLLGSRSVLCSPYPPGLMEPTTALGAQLGIKLNDKASLSVGISISTTHNPYELHTNRFDPGRNPRPVDNSHNPSTRMAGEL